MAQEHQEKNETKSYKMSYKMVITPAIPIEDRHIIMATLETLGYDVYGAGADTNEASCDISFE